MNSDNTITKPKPILITRDWLLISILSMITVLVWIGVSVYHTVNTSTVNEPQQARMKLISVELDEAVITELSGKKNLSTEILDENERVILKTGEEQARIEGSAGGL